MQYLLIYQTVVDIQRGFDLLCSFENIDLNRLAYIGHSLGATWGGEFLLELKNVLDPMF